MLDSLEDEDENINIDEPLSPEDHIVEDLVADAPILIQTTICKLLKNRNHLKQQTKNLKVKLRKAQNWCEELRLQIEELNGKLAEKTKLKSCPKCIKFKRQLKARKNELKDLHAELAARDKETTSTNTQTTEEDLRQAAWVYEYNLNVLNVPRPPLNKTDSEEGAQSLVNDIREAAEDALIQQGMVLEKTSGLYYDYKTGYYYDAEKSLYYDGNTGTYLKYDEETKQYVIESSLPEEEIVAQKELARRKSEMSQHKVKRRKLSNGCSTTSHNNDSQEEGGDGVRIKQGKDGDGGIDNDQEKYGDDDDILESSIPCIRLCVVQSEDERVQVGSLYIVTCKGGTVGSKGSHEVLLSDLGCSKLHARFTFNTDKCAYTIRDLGSRNGTWVNGKRISKAKEESKEISVGHKTMIQIGKTRLCCHVHPGVETCRDCEPGLVLKEIKTDPTQNGMTKEVLRKVELKEMRAKYGLGVGLKEEPDQNTKRYKDRAEERRIIHGIDPINAKTETASEDQAIGNKNKGFKMLEKMGWDGGGLGRDKTGIQEPIQVQQRAKQAGLGAVGSNNTQDVSAKEKKKNEIWKKTAKRFTKVPTLDAFKQEESEEES